MMRVGSSEPQEWLFCGETVADGTRPLQNNSWGTSISCAQDAYGAAYANFGVLSSAYDIYEWSIGVYNCGSSGNARLGMVKLGIDLAGGTNFTDFLVDLAVGAAAGQGNIFGIEKLNSWKFRKRIPAGASIGVKGAIHTSSLTAFRGWIFDAFGRPRRPELARTHEYCDSFGASVATCRGTTVTPGDASDGAWTEIGTLTRKLGWFEYSLAFDENVSAANTMYTDIALGDANNKRVIIKNHITTISTAELTTRSGPAGVAALGNAGDKVYARVQVGPNALDDGIYSVAVYGCGG